ncbi:hypothetical protein OK349_04805 [Sphingomonas sp. BT-65]|uniref:hypothetical protein n=1 Tax=Sphingomonas sp. BT-65 TaxID=2989821 RepID=UPI002236B38A|nr:hypothetical protein [Sphingomonas sp. BT-65]MCW4461017.1 hypothetical protein [Sphingomonas sp. BT-65]
MTERQDAFNFTVTINDVVLDQETIARIEERLGKMLLEELAKLDGKGDLVAKPLPTARSIGGGLDGDHTAGMSIGRG